MTTREQKEKFGPLAIITIIILIIFVITMIIPVAWTFMTSLKSAFEYDYGLNGAEPNKLWFPQVLTFENYGLAYKYFKIIVPPKQPGDYARQYNIVWQFINSLLYSVGCSVAVTFTSLIMGYASARFRYRFSNFIYVFVVATMALPIVGAMPSEIAVAQKLNIFDTFPGMWIMRATFLNTYFLIFHAQFKMIPYDYTEAAKIDGANQFTIMFKIIVPLAMGTVSSVFVLNFIALWNDFQIPMVYLPSHPVAAYGMYRFQYSTEDELKNIPTQIAGIWLMALPIVIFYAIFNKKLSVNLSVGGIKG